MGVAGLPSAPIKSSALDPFEDKIADLIFMGWPIRKIAKELEPEDKKARKHLRVKLNRLAKRPEFSQAIAERANVQMMTDLGPATQALGRRAKKGRPDAIKLLFEASGFHNPRVKHEHSGDIKITLNSMPRPDLGNSDDDDVMDAEVVDEDDA